MAKNAMQDLTDALNKRDAALLAEKTALDHIRGHCHNTAICPVCKHGRSEFDRGHKTGFERGSKEAMGMVASGELDPCSVCGDTRPGYHCPGCGSV